MIDVFFRFNDALNSQPRWYALQQNYFLWSGYLCIVLGCLFVFSSYFALGFYGTFLGELRMFYMCCICSFLHLYINNFMRK